MSQQAVEQLIDRWITDAEFREALRADPEAAVKAAGVELTEEEWAALRAIDWAQSDDELYLHQAAGGG